MDPERSLNSFFMSSVSSPLEELNAFSGKIVDFNPECLFVRPTPLADLSRHVIRGFLQRLFWQFLHANQDGALAKFVNSLFKVLKVSANVDLSLVNEALSASLTDLMGTLTPFERHDHHPVYAVFCAMHHIEAEHVLAFRLLLNVIPDGSHLLVDMPKVVGLFLLSLQSLATQRNDRFITLAIGAFRGKLFPHVAMMQPPEMDMIRQVATKVAADVFQNWTGTSEMAMLFTDIIMGEGVRFSSVVKSMEQPSAESTIHKKFVHNVVQKRSYRMIRHLLYGPGSAITTGKQFPVILELAAVYLVALARATTHSAVSKGSVCRDGNCMMCCACVEQVRIRSADLLSEVPCTRRVCVYSLISKLAEPWGEYTVSLLKRRTACFGERDLNSHLVCGCPVSDSTVSFLPCKRPLVFSTRLGTPAASFVLHLTRKEEPLRPCRSPDVNYNAFYRVDPGNSSNYIFFKINGEESASFIYTSFQQLLRKTPAGVLEPLSPVLAAVALNSGNTTHAFNCVVKVSSPIGGRKSELPEDAVLARFVCAALVKEGSGTTLSRFVALVETSDYGRRNSVESILIPNHLRVPSNSAKAVLTPSVCKIAFTLLKEALPFLLNHVETKTRIKQFVQGPLAEAVGSSPRAWGYSHLNGYCTYQKSISRLFPRQNREAMTVLLILQRLRAQKNAGTLQPTRLFSELAFLPLEIVTMCILNFL